MDGLQIATINTVDSQYERYDKVVNGSRITITYTLHPCYEVAWCCEWLTDYYHLHYQIRHPHA